MFSKVNRSADGFSVVQDPVRVVADSWRAEYVLCIAMQMEDKRESKALIVEQSCFFSLFSSERECESF